MISFCCLGLLGSGPGFSISLSRAGEKVDKMHHMSQCWLGGGGEGGTGQSWVYFASLLHAAAGAKQDTVCVQNPQDILDRQKQVMFSFTPALLPTERTEWYNSSGLREKLQWNCATVWSCKKVWSARAAPAAQRLHYPHCPVWWVSQGAQLRRVHLRPLPVGQHTLTFPGFVHDLQILLS